MRALAHVSDAPAYNTAAVVQRTGVPATTFRAWERRYGYPRPQRDPGGQRLYSERDIEGIRWLSNQTSQGVAISRAVAMLRGGYARGAPASTEPAAAPGPRSFGAVRTDLLQALLALDVRGADASVAEAFALFSVEDVCLQLFESLLVEVGDRWHAGELSVGEEHFVTCFIRSRLFALLGAYQRPDLPAPLVFTACAPGEWHELGILVLSVFLSRRGVAVRYLGPNLPLEALAHVVAKHHPSVVALSAQSREAARALRRAPALLADGAAPHPRLVFGGQAFNADAGLRPGVAGTYVGPSAVTAADAIVRLLESASTPPRRRARSPARGSRS